MPPFVDLHCHLFAGLDDGPKSLEEAVEMCRLASENGTQTIAGVAHLHPQWPLATRDSILESHRELNSALKREGVAISTFPSSEVLIQPELLQSLDDARLVTVGDRQRHLLVELPPSVAVDVNGLFGKLMHRRIRPILAHPERHNHLIDEPILVEELIRSGALMQVNASSLVDSAPRRLRQIKSWFERRMIHVVGSDGHRMTKRLPVVKQAWRVAKRWVGESEATRIFCTNGKQIVDGKDIQVPDPEPVRKRRWFFSMGR